MKILIKLGFLLWIMLFSNFKAHPEAITNAANIQHDVKKKTVILTSADRSISLVIDYNTGCRISGLMVKGENVLSQDGVYTGFKINDVITSSSSSKVEVVQKAGVISIGNIRYGTEQLGVKEIWSFHFSGNKILWDIQRIYDNSVQVEEIYFPQWNFAALTTWKGGMIDNGGVVWCKYLSGKNDTYGVHTGGVTFWEPESGNALKIVAKQDKQAYVAAKFSHGEKNEFTFTQFVTDSALNQRYDLSRFVSGKSDVFAPVKVSKGVMNLGLVIQYVDYPKTYSRGELIGIDAIAVRELLNTTARYGVVDNHIIGANGWVTNWKCLHEPFFAQIGMALNDAGYTANLSATLNQERDLAMKPDGRVLSRWHNAPGDEIPGTYDTKTGYYEAMWGYTIDSQTGYVINTSEQFDLNGDVSWLRAHKASCERALEWLIRRDTDRNGLFEMMNNDISEQKASDWLDIVWASYENAFVNAQMYEALTLWSERERILGDHLKSKYYLEVASRLKTAFNKPLEEGGFWSEAKGQYVYWRDRDGSVHGDNLVTPVNFAAIAFGICDDGGRVKKILDQIEQRNLKENLFHWPLCFDSFRREEVQQGNWPFPRYENGDIFPTWGYLGVRAYAGYDRVIALKYIKNILQKYNKDGLSSQRYSRTTQKGLGEDILAGICTSITALYRDVYGVRPKWNRMGLEPNMLPELNGTQFTYTLRNVKYLLKLNDQSYEISSEGYTVRSPLHFGVALKESGIMVYQDNKEDHSLLAKSASGKPFLLEIISWNEGFCSWKTKSSGKHQFTFTGLKPGNVYQLAAKGSKILIKVGLNGQLKSNWLAGEAYQLKLVD